MLLTIVSPTSKKEYEIIWIEINTPTGNLIIQDHHAPLVSLIKKQTEITFCFSTGKQETIFLHTGGIFKVNRLTALLVMN